MKSYSLENCLRESIFREDLILYNCLQRTNPTIAAMEIMTRKENAQNAMEERIAKGLRAKQGQQQQQRQPSQGTQQHKANTSVTASSMSLRPISSPVASQNAKLLAQPSNSKHQESPAPAAKVQSSPQPARRPAVAEPSPARKAVAAVSQPQAAMARPSQEQLRAQKMREEAERQRKEQGRIV